MMPQKRKPSTDLANRYSATCFSFLQSEECFTAPAISLIKVIARKIIIVMVMRVLFLRRTLLITFLIPPRTTWKYLRNVALHWLQSEPSSFLEDPVTFSVSILDNSREWWRCAGVCRDGFPYVEGNIYGCCSFLWLWLLSPGTCGVCPVSSCLCVVCTFDLSNSDLSLW